MAQTIRMQVPLDHTIRDAFDAMAVSLGFDSAQAYVRFWVKAQVDGRSMDISRPNTLSPASLAVINFITMHLQIYEAEQQQFESPNEVIKHLHATYNHKQLEQYLDQLVHGGNFKATD